MKRIFFPFFGLLFVLFFTGMPEAHAQLRTCKPGEGSIIYVEGVEVRKCAQPITPQHIKLLYDIIKATTKPLPSPEFKKNENFCNIYRQRNDVPNQLKYCGALSDMGSLSATDIMCELHYEADYKSPESLTYCSKSSNADRVTGHFLMFMIKSNSGDNVEAMNYLYRGIERSFIKNPNPTRLDIVFGSPSNEIRKIATELYLTYAGENLFGASLSSLGFPEIQISPSMSMSNQLTRSTIVNDWIGLVDTYPLHNISSPLRVSFVIFTIPTGQTAEPILCYMKDTDGKILKGDEYKAACGYIITHSRFASAVDINGDFAPSFIYGNAEIRLGEVALVN